MELEPEPAKKQEPVKKPTGSGTLVILYRYYAILVGLHERGEHDGEGCEGGDGDAGGAAGAALRHSQRHRVQATGIPTVYYTLPPGEIK